MLAVENGSKMRMMPASMGPLSAPECRVGRDSTGPIRPVTPAIDASVSGQLAPQTDPAHAFQAHRLRTRLHASLGKPQPAAHTGALKKSERLPSLSGQKKNAVDGFHLRRTAFLLRYADASGLQRGALPLGPNPEKTGDAYLGAEQLASSPAGFVLDSVLAAVLAPFGLIYAFKAAKHAIHDFKASARLKTCHP